MEAAVEYEPFAVDVMTDPYPVYRELRAGARVYPLPQYDAYALPRFDDVWRVLADRDRFSIVEGPVFHRQLLLEHHDTAPDSAVPTPLPSFSMLDPPAHTRAVRPCSPRSDRVRSRPSNPPSVDSPGRGSMPPITTGSTCATTTRRRCRPRWPRSNWAFPWTTPSRSSRWSTGSCSGSRAAPGSVQEGGRPVASCRTISSRWSRPVGAPRARAAPAFRPPNPT